MSLILQITQKGGQDKDLAATAFFKFKNIKICLDIYEPTRLNLKSCNHDLLKLHEDCKVIVFRLIFYPKSLSNLRGRLWLLN